MPHLLKYSLRELVLLGVQTAMMIVPCLFWLDPLRLAAQTELKPAESLAISGVATGLHPSLHLTDRIVQNAQLLGREGSSWKFGISTAGVTSTLGVQQIVRWGSWRGIVDRPAVWLSDGSWLAGEVSWRGNESLNLQTRWLNVPAIPLRLVRGVVLTPAASLPDWINLQREMQFAQGEDDIVWLNDQRRLSGVVDWASIENGNLLKISTAGQDVIVPLDNVVAITASPALFDEPAEANARIALGDGSLLNALEIQSTEATTIVSLSSIAQLESLDRTADFIRAITYLSHADINKTQRLDQLKPRSYRHVPEGYLEYALGVGRDVNGHPLKVGSRRRAGIAFYGLALHSSSQAAYAWDRSPGKFLAEVQIAPSASTSGSVTCKVLVARSGNLQTLSEFHLSTRNSAPSHMVDIDITNAQLVVLVVEKADHGQFGDHTLWLDARFVKL